METDRMIYLVTEYAAGGEIFGEYLNYYYGQINFWCNNTVIIDTEGRSTFIFFFSISYIDI